ncbi:hypothetical protein SAMN05421796_11413 [Chryseobacterium piscicola]|uniref:DUF4347 domain-containing protein n=1 Tax=Chryseobacterium piscicola TaxID=551459 RepID=A0A1N7PG50_9FLAO|nr:hypothetical protein [Chryseobacterium piscicola]PQA92077.1 hypothetical protein B0A70_11660 [Chryseobacterium piscicola]SIT09507.1 hypothetical protein SAMN05421796_11413 [Chryseobacterium piscicola]
MSPGFFKFGDDANTFRNFVRLRQRAHDGYVKILCHGDPKSVFINGKKLKPQELADYILQQGYEKGELIRLISCQTGAKSNGFAKKLAEILDTPRCRTNPFVWLFLFIFYKFCCVGWQ